jgi:hypothetical protein
MSVETSDSTVPRPLVDMKLLIRGLAAMAVLNGTAVAVFVGFFPLILLSIGAVTHPSVLKIPIFFVFAVFVGVLVLWVSIKFGLFIFYRMFSSFGWRIFLGVCLVGWCLLLIPINVADLFDVAVYGAFLVLSLYGLVTKQPVY